MLKHINKQAILLIVFIVFSIFIILRASHNRKGVIVRNRIFGNNFLNRKDPYFNEKTKEYFHGPYPPSFSLIAVPLSLLPLKSARIVWASLQCLCLLALFILASKWSGYFGSAVKEKTTLIFVLSFIIIFRFFLRDTAGGGGNLIYSTLALLSLYLYLNKMEFFAGAPLALTISLKPNLIFVLIFYIFPKPKLKFLLSFFVFFVTFILLPSIFYGFEPYIALWKIWVKRVFLYFTLPDLHNTMVIPEAMPKPAFAMNQCLREAIFRLFRTPGSTGACDVHILILPVTIVRLLGFIVSLILILLSIKNQFFKNGKAVILLKFLSLFPLCLLLSPVSWKAHHVILLMPFWVIISILINSKIKQKTIIVFIIIYFLFISLPGQDLVGKHLKNLMQALSLVSWGNIGLIIIFSYYIRKMDLFSLDDKKQ